MSLKYHPDRHPNDDSKRDLFEKLKYASEILSQERTRAIYDQWLKSKYDTELRYQSQTVERQKAIDELLLKEQKYE